VAKIFYAHSTKNLDESDWQTLPEHLHAVGELAGHFAKPFDSTLLAQTAGKLHDLGKYTDPFQKRLRGGAKVDHATWGARIACERYGTLGRLMAYGIGGHHAGLANGRDPGSRTALNGRLDANLPQLHSDYLHDLALPADGSSLTPKTWKPNPARSSSCRCSRA